MEAHGGGEAVDDVDGDFLVRGEHSSKPRADRLPEVEDPARKSFEQGRLAAEEALFTRLTGGATSK